MEESRYKVDNKILGRGAFGVVKKAYDTQRKQMVALKYFDAASRSATESFYRERTLLHKLRNVPHVVNLYDAFKTDDKKYNVLVIQYVPNGLSLENKKFESAHVHQIAVESLKGLKAIHALGIIHGDVKAENILYSPHSGSVIIDFGLSCFTIDTQKSRSRSSTEVPYACEQSGVYEGTPVNFSLDRLRVINDENAVSLETYFKIMRKDDLFAFGIVLYELYMQKRYEPNYKLHTLRTEDILALLKNDNSMVPVDLFNERRSGRPSKVRLLTESLLVAAYYKRPTATEALSFLLQRSPSASSASLSSGSISL